MPLVTINVPAEAASVLDEYAKELRFAGLRAMAIAWLKGQYRVAMKRKNEQAAKELVQGAPADPDIT